MRLIRITTVPISLKFLLAGQMRFMANQGIDVVTMSSSGTEIDEIVKRELCKHEIIPLTRKITPLTDLKAIWVLYKKLKDLQPDIVHTHTPKAGLIGMIASWLAKVPVRVHTVAGLPLQTQKGLKRKILIWVEMITYFFANEVWPNSASLYSFIVDHQLANVKKLHIIGKGSSNGIDITEFNEDHLDDGLLLSIKNKIEYDPKYKYLLFVGRVVKDKGVIELVDSFLAVKKAFPNTKLIIVGPLENDLDPLPERILSLISSHEDIIFVGFSNEVKYYMALSNLFIFPSHREGFPNVPLQAGLMNLPVICSDIGGNIDIISHQNSGLVFKVGSVSELTRQIRFLLQNDVLAQKMANNNKINILNNFSRESVHQCIYERYLQLLKTNAV